MLRKMDVRTGERVEMVDITSQVSEVIARSGVREGTCLVYCPHTTAAVTINENADPDVVRDIVMETNKVIPFDDGYRHAEGNSAGHIKSSLFGPSLTLIVDDGALLLGTWQGIYFCEFDGPRERTTYIKVTEG